MRGGRDATLVLVQLRALEAHLETLPIEDATEALILLPPALEWVDRQAALASRNQRAVPSRHSSRQPIVGARRPSPEGDSKSYLLFLAGGHVLSL